MKINCVIIDDEPLAINVIEGHLKNFDHIEVLATFNNPLKAFGILEQEKVDVIFLDLEDAVAPDEKEQARKNIIEGLNDIDWNTKTMSVRINGLDTHLCTVML